MYPSYTQGPWYLPTFCTHGLGRGVPHYLIAVVPLVLFREHPRQVQTPPGLCLSRLSPVTHANTGAPPD